MEAKFYLVGGAVRDELLGLKSKDLDYSVEASSYDAMKEAVVARCGGDPLCVKVEKPEFVTIRAVHPELGGLDFVLCRKESAYSDGRRPDFVEAGTLLDDLSRRDFTIGAMAKADDGSIIDPFGGQADLQARVLRCVGHTQKRMTEDALRMLRAVRFSLTKGFTLHPELESFLLDQKNVDLLANVSAERVREELVKCFAHNTLATLQLLEKFWRLRQHVFNRNLKLVPTVYNP